MKRISLIAALLGGIVLAFSGIAMASTGGANSGTNWGGGTTGNGASVTHYAANYVDPFFGGVNCVGVHQAKKGNVIQDSFTCTSTQGGLQNIQPNESLTLQTISGWISDIDHATYATSFSGTVSADGMSYTAVATY
jgi:hypothetical protein